MRFGNGAADGEAEARMVAEAFPLGPVGMEAAEHRLAAVGGDAGAFIGDFGDDLSPRLPDRDPHCAVLRGEGHGVVDEVFGHAFKLGGHAHHLQGAAARQVQLDPPPAVHPPVLAAADQVGEEFGKVDPLQRGAADFGIDAAGGGDFGDEAIDAAHIVGSNADKLGAQVRVIHPRQGVDGVAQGRQRVLDFMRHIRGEAVDRVDALAQCAGHVRDRAGKQADLVAALGQARHLHLAVAPLLHPHGSAREQAQRGDDGPREEQRERRRGRHHQQHRHE